jgi:hypothetical protein
MITAASRTRGDGEALVDLERGLERLGKAGATALVVLPGSDIGTHAIPTNDCDQQDDAEQASAEEEILERGERVVEVLR